MKIKGVLKPVEWAARDRQPVQGELERVLCSRVFSRNERLSRFLRLVVERYLDGRDDEIKESVIALEVFGRKPGYDPKRDSIVRTEAVRLRARLIEYYAGEGSGDPVIIELPKGGYIPAFHEREVKPAEEPPVARAGVNRPVVWLGAFAFAALAAAAWWWFQYKSVPITIAVLPLENLVGDPADDYFADGLTN